MSALLDHKIRGYLLDYLSGSVTLDQVKDWLIAVTWDDTDKRDERTRALTYEIHLAFAEQSSGITTEVEMRTELAELVTR